MPPNNRDAGYLWDMLQAARRLQEFTAGSFRNIVGRMLEANGRGFCQPSEEKLEKLRELYDLTDEEIEGVIV